MEYIFNISEDSRRQVMIMFQQQKISSSYNDTNLTKENENQFLIKKIYTCEFVLHTNMTLHHLHVFQFKLPHKYISIHEF